MDSILIFYCKKCGKQNAYNQGDLSDYTIQDPDALKCYSCGELEIHNEEWESYSDEMYVETAHPIGYYKK
jgi:hypothetical protein